MSGVAERRFTRVAAHLAPNEVTATSEVEPVQVASADVHGQGHVHPSIALAPDGAIVIVFAADETAASGKDVLLVTRSVGGESFSEPVPIPCTRRRPPEIRDTGQHEVYPGTLDLLPDGRLLVRPPAPSPRPFVGNRPPHLLPPAHLELHRERRKTGVLRAGSALRHQRFVRVGVVGAHADHRPKQPP